MAPAGSEKPEVVTYALDACAMLRYIDGEAGSDRVAEIFLAKAAKSVDVVMSAIRWGEVAGIMHKRHGSDAVQSLLQGFESLPITIISATAERAAHSAAIHFKYKIPYADSFGLDLASDSWEHCFLTADFDLKPAESDFRIVFLPTKPKP